MLKRSPRPTSTDQPASTAGTPSRKRRRQAASQRQKLAPLRKKIQAAETEIRGLQASLGDLDLSNNPNLTDIQPLLDNTGIGVGGSYTINLLNTNVSCSDVAALEAKGVLVTSDCS